MHARISRGLGADWVVSHSLFSHIYDDDVGSFYAIIDLWAAAFSLLTICVIVDSGGGARQALMFCSKVVRVRQTVGWKTGQL